MTCGPIWKVVRDSQVRLFHLPIRYYFPHTLTVLAVVCYKNVLLMLQFTA